MQHTGGARPQQTGGGLSKNFWRESNGDETERRRQDTDRHSEMNKERGRGPNPPERRKNTRKKNRTRIRRTREKKTKGGGSGGEDAREIEPTGTGGSREAFRGRKREDRERSCALKEGPRTKIVTAGKTPRKNGLPVRPLFLWMKVLPRKARRKSSDPVRGGLGGWFRLLQLGRPSSHLDLRSIMSMLGLVCKETEKKNHRRGTRKSLSHHRRYDPDRRYTSEKKNKNIIANMTDRTGNFKRSFRKDDQFVHGTRETFKEDSHENRPSSVSRHQREGLSGRHGTCTTGSSRKKKDKRRIAA